MKIFIALLILLFLNVILAAQEIPPAVEQAKECVFMYQIDLTFEGVLVREKLTPPYDTLRTYTTTVSYGNAIQINQTDILSVNHNFPSTQSIIRDYFQSRYLAFIRPGIRSGYWPLSINKIIVTHQLTSKQGYIFRLIFPYQAYWSIPELNCMDFSENSIQMLIESLNEQYIIQPDSTFCLVKRELFKDLMLLRLNHPLPRSQYLSIQTPVEHEYSQPLWSISLSPSLFPDNSFQPCFLHVASGSFVYYTDKFQLPDKVYLYLNGALLNMTTLLGNSGSAVFTSSGQLYGLTIGTPINEYLKIITGCSGAAKYRNVILSDDIIAFLNGAK